MKNIKRILTASLAALTFCGLTACAKVESYNIEFGQGYKCESFAKESQVRMYKDGKLVAKKIFEGDRHVYAKSIYELYDDQGRKFAEAELNSEIIHLEYRIEPPYIYGNLKANDYLEWQSNDKSVETDITVEHSIPLWKDKVDEDLKMIKSSRNIRMHIIPLWNEADEDLKDGNKCLLKAYNLFLDFLIGEELLEKKYDKDF